MIDTRNRHGKLRYTLHRAGLSQLPHVELDTAALDPRHRVAEFEAVRANICQLLIAPAGEGFASRTRIALIGQTVFADTRHSACVTNRTLAQAAASTPTVSAWRAPPAPSTGAGQRDAFHLHRPFDRRDGPDETLCPFIVPALSPLWLVPMR